MRFTKLLAGLALTTALHACNHHTAPQVNTAGTASNILTAKEKNEGWQLLFDGSSYKGWSKYGGAPVGKGWVIQDNSIHLDAVNKAGWQTNDGGDIVSSESFGDFHLQYDWKVDRGGNSGLIFYVHEDTTKYQWPWQSGPEMQVLDNERHADAKIIKHRAGDLYDLVSAGSEPVKPALEWNHAEIISQNGRLRFFLNGVPILSVQMWDEAWNKLIAGSKFHNMPGFGTYRSGKISLQDHGDRVWYRNIKIRKFLPAEAIHSMPIQKN